MTTAHRPTWKAAKGGEEQGGMRIFAPSQQRSVKDLPNNATLKFRDLGQASAAELRKRDLKAELLARERKHFAERLGGPGAGLGAGERAFDRARESDLRLLDRAVPKGGGGGGGKGGAGDGGGKGGVGDGGGGSASSRSPGASDSPGTAPPLAAASRYADRDADARVDSSDDDEEEEEGGRGAGAPGSRAPGSGSGSDSGSDSDDEEAALMAELARLRAERKAEAARRAAAEREAEAARAKEEALVGNPLLTPALGGGGSKALKRRWDDDVVFRNQDRSKPQETRRFINDTIRNDFHKRFLDRYMR